MKKLLAFIMAGAMIFSSAANVFAQQEYVRTGFTEEDVVKYADDAAIIRLGNSEYYLNNIRKAFFTYSDSITPYEEDSTVFVPAAPLLEALGASVKEDGNEKYVVEAENKSYILSTDGSSDVKCVMRNGELFAPAEYIAKAVNKNYIKIDDIVIISSKLSADTKIPQTIIEKFKQRLEYRWNNVHLGSLGFVTGLITHPNDPELVYARTDVGGMYRLNTRNNSWTPLLDLIPNSDKALQGVRSIAIDPNDSNILYAACGMYDYSSPSDILKSVDRGENWVRLGFNQKFGGNMTHTRFSGECLMVDPNDSKVIYCGTYNSGVWKSENGGETWTNIASVPAVAKGIAGGTAFVYIDSRTKTTSGQSRDIYVGVYGDGVYVSQNGGNSFVPMEGAPKMPCRMEFVGNKLYMSATDDNAKNPKMPGGFFCYENGKWRDLTPSENGRYAVNGFLIDRTNPNTILISSAPYRAKNLYRSYDGGETWDYLGAYKDCSGCMIQDPKNDKGFYMAYGAGIYYVSDFHSNNIVTEPRDSNIEELVTSKVITLPSKKAPKVLTQFMDWGMKVNERLDTMYEPTKPLASQGAGIDFCESDPRIVFRTGIVNSPDNGQSNAALSTDYGRHFNAVKWISDRRIVDCAVSAVKQKNGYPILMVVAVSGDRGVYRSKDGGETWEKMPGAPVIKTSAWFFMSHLIAADRVDGNTFYYTEDSSVYVTRDGGDTWNLSKSFTKTGGDQFIRAIPGVEGGVWFKNKDGLYVSYDKAASWTLMPDVASPIGFGFGIGKKENDVPAAYLLAKVKGEYGMFMSDDLGGKWTRINDNANDFPAGIYDVNGDRNVYGRVFVATGGKGVIYGQPISVDDEGPLIMLLKQLMQTVMLFR